MNKRRNGFTVMARLIGLVKPLAGYMVLAVTMGLIGHLCASFITIFGGYASAKVLGIDISFSLAFLFVSVKVLVITEVSTRIIVPDIINNPFVSFADNLFLRGANLCKLIKEFFVRSTPNGSLSVSQSGLFCDCKFSYSKSN